MGKIYTYTLNTESGVPKYRKYRHTWDSVSEVKKRYAIINRVLNGQFKTCGEYKWGCV